MTDPDYDPKVYLAVDIKQAAVDMIEAIGVMYGCAFYDNSGVNVAFANIEDAVNKAVRATANYKRAIASGRERVTRAEYEASPCAEAAPDAAGAS